MVASIPHPQPDRVRETGHAGRRLLALCVVAGALLAAPAASGITPAERADAMAKGAMAEFDAGQFARAGAIFEEAFLLHPLHKYAWNAARLYERTGDLVRAHRLYRQAVPVAPDAGTRAKDAAAIGKLDAELLRRGFVRILITVIPSEAEVALGGEPLPLVAGGRLAWRKPGLYLLEARSPGFAPHRAEVVVGHVAEVRVDAALGRAQVPVGPAEKVVEPRPQPVVTSPEPAKSARVEIAKSAEAPAPAAGAWKRSGAIASTCAGIVFVASGVVLAASGAAGVRDANARVLGSAAEYPDYESAYASAATKYWLGMGLTGLGIAAAGAAGWMWFSRPVDAAPSRASLGVAPDGRAQLTVRF